MNELLKRIALFVFVFFYLSCTQDTAQWPELSETAWKQMKTETLKELLVDNDVNLFADTAAGGQTSALSNAIFYGSSPQVVAALYEAGATMPVGGSAIATAVLGAASSEVFDVIVANGGRLDTKVWQEIPSIVLAVGMGKTDVIATLLNYDVDLMMEVDSNITVDGFEFERGDRVWDVVRRLPSEQRNAIRDMLPPEPPPNSWRVSPHEDEMTGDISYTLHGDAAEHNLGARHWVRLLFRPAQRSGVSEMLAVYFDGQTFDIRGGDTIEVMFGDGEIVSVQAKPGFGAVVLIDNQETVSFIDSIWQLSPYDEVRFRAPTRRGGRAFAMFYVSNFHHALDELRNLVDSN